MSLASTSCLILGGATAGEIPASLVTPDKVETRIGTLEFKDGAPSPETMEKVYENLDFTHAFNAFMNTMQGVSIEALHQGFLDAGVKDNEVIVFSKLMDAKSLFLTPNADTVYVMSMLDLSKGPVVMEVPPGVADFLAGKAKLAKIAPPPPTVFHEGTGKVMNTVMPNDWSYFEMLNEVVQREPATSLDRELMGPVAAIGIVKGKAFAPDQRMKKIMTEALAVANATARTLVMNGRDPSWQYYPGSSWLNPLFVSGYEFETPIPEVTKEGVKPFPPTGYRQLDARTTFFYGYTGITPAMAMRVPGIGSQYLLATLDADKNYLDGAKTYKVTLPPNIPEANFWSFTLYDNMTRSELDTPQRYPRAGSQSFPSPAAEASADGSTTIWFAPEQPEGVARGNWVQTVPGKGWWTVLRLYSPLEPFFTKEWRPSEIELVK
jgi:hypothetical protein